MKILRDFLVSFLCLVICGKALAWHECGVTDANTGALMKDEMFITEESASLVFIGKLTSQARWSLLSAEDESGKPIAAGFHPVMEKNTFKILEVLKGSPLAEEIVIAYEGRDGWHLFQTGKTYKIYTVDGANLAFHSVDSCYFLAYPFSDDIHGAMK
jgi:hypothetical protein